MPLYTMRQKPAALDIYKRLPHTNFRECGQKTCTAIALTLWRGNARPMVYKPIFGGEHAHLRDAFPEICVGLGFTTGENFSEPG